MLVREQIEAVRTMLVGSMTDTMSVLDEPYTAGDSQVRLRYALRNFQPGQLVSLGLNTFYVWEVSSDSRTLTVSPSVDGGPDVSVADGQFVRANPQHTTWSLFSSWNRHVKEMSSPYNGLYAYGTFGSNPNYTSGTYPLPTTGTWATMTPIRLVKAEYRPWGSDAWERITRAEWQPDNGAVYLRGPQPEGDLLQFVFAFPFTEAATLDTDVSTIGLSQFNWDIPGLAVAADMMRGREGRRSQPHSQGDPRRASEIAPGNNLGVGRDWSLEWSRRIMEELSRQTALYGWKRPMP